MSETLKLNLYAMIALVFSVLAEEAQANGTPQSISVCVEDRFWPTSSFFINGEAKGTQIALITHAFEKAGIRAVFHRMPWKRCLNAVKSGEIDTIAGTAYYEQRATDYYFPSHPTNVGDHPQSLEKVEFILVTTKHKVVGDLHSGAQPPEPLAVPLGYATGPIYRAQGLSVVEMMNHREMFDLLLRKRIGSFIMARHVYDVYTSEQSRADQFTAHTMPDRVGPLYLAFSRQTDVPDELQQTIWRHIEALRSDTSFMQHITTSALEEALSCLRSQKC